MKKTYLLILFTVLIFSLIGCSNSQPNGTDPAVETTQGEAASDHGKNETEPALDISDYTQRVEQLNADIMEASLVLGNLGKWEVNYMSTLGRPSDDMVDRAFSWLESKSEYTREDVEAAEASILDEYTKLAADTKGDEADKLFEKLSPLYESYFALYNTVTTVPISASDFADDLTKNLSAVADASEALGSALVG